jgi:predicted nucleotidyltransferase component of viral defense system
MQIPLANRLKKRLHVDLAALQDEVVEIIYDLENQAVLHGGTAIWRCYDGSRFSEDLDFYIMVKDNFQEHLEDKLTTRELTLSKYKKTKNVIFSKISNGTVEVRLEISLRKVHSVARPYERSNGTTMTILTLSPEALIMEKIAAYNSRLLVRDIYDIYHLSSYADTAKLNKKLLSDFLPNIKKPLDERNLKTLIYSGAFPSFDQMIEILKSRFSL